ncbi:putative mfs transporter [Phaeomoniella chlamydospora]|uniref:Putative mfs transporter n=1 Tax=Phaeomoniella chlamydospora TaxID=158046 RepID=A0A0G2DVL5_PHACM|nr:putative mfs transporter [Phaeomoniella chlamydospora]
MHRSGRFYHIILLGSILMILGWGLFTDIKPITSIGKVMAFEIVTGLDVGFLFDAPLLSLQASVEQHDVATATATAGFIRNLAMSISIVVSGTIFENGMSLQAPKLLKAGLPATLISEFEHGQASANVDIIRTIDDHSQRLAIKAAYASSLRLVWISLAAAAGAGFIVSIFIKDSVLSDTHTETKTGLRNQRDRRSNRGRREE